MQPLKKEAVIRSYIYIHGLCGFNGKGVILKGDIDNRFSLRSFSERFHRLKETDRYHDMIVDHSYRRVVTSNRVVTMMYGEQRIISLLSKFYIRSNSKQSTTKRKIGRIKNHNYVKKK